MTSELPIAELDVVIPVYNEGANIVPVLRSLREHVASPLRVLICYDRDDDDTLPAIRENPVDLEIVLVKNQGQGAHGAIMTGFASSRAPAVLVFPADDTLNAVIIDQMLGLMRSGCEIVAASRFIPGGSMQGCPWVKSVLVRTASFTLHHLARLPVHDATNGLRMFSRRVIQSIPIESTRGFTFSIELTVKCQRLGWRIAEVPSQWVERTQGQSRFRVFKWLTAYLRWYFYAFSTTWLGRRHVAGVRTEKLVEANAS
jgi:glycosyltransferase involved in cell wall biosynthesis